MEKGREKQFFARPDVMVVLTTSPAGLGHVRVSEALRGGLGDARAEIIGLESPATQFLHRMASRDPFLQRLMEFVQNNPLVEGQFTKIYRSRLRQQGSEAYGRLVELVKRRRPKPAVLIILATHFSLAHQVAAVKERLARELRLCVALAVVVTDDSPQQVWGVLDADFLFVPSLTTKEGLERYLTTLQGNIPEAIVVPYPVSADFCKRLTVSEYRERQAQVSPRLTQKMKIVIPISGAAVQLTFFEQFISALGKGGSSEITVISRESAYTKHFLAWCQSQPSVRVVAERHDREVVASYEREYREGVFAVEVTKPSEQSFKALNTPRQRGGVVLLFSEPIGRQEYDNLAFLARHELLPSPRDRLRLERFLRFGERRLIDQPFLTRAERWRGLMLPTSGWEAGMAIEKLRRSGILAAMVDFTGYMEHAELRGDGVKQIWKILAAKVGEKCGMP